jgi:hypothetical protein
MQIISHLAQVTVRNIDVVIMEDGNLRIWRGVAKLTKTIGNCNVKKMTEGSVIGCLKVIISKGLMPGRSL